MSAVVVAQEIGSLLAWIRDALEEPAEDGPLQLYALLDGARDEQIVPKIRASGLEVRCLLDGELHPALAAAAPYLVALDPGAPFTRTLLAQGWGDAWGVFLTSVAPIDALRRHFRKFLRVVDEDGKPLMFRYYDPRVLRIYLPTCTSEELALVFGPVAAYLIEDSGEAKRPSGTQMRLVVAPEGVSLEALRWDPPQA